MPALWVAGAVALGAAVRLARRRGGTISLLAFWAVERRKRRG